MVHRSRKPGGTPWDVLAGGEDVVVVVRRGGQGEVARVEGERAGCVGQPRALGEGEGGRRGWPCRPNGDEEPLIEGGHRAPQSS